MKNNGFWCSLHGYETQTRSWTHTYPRDLSPKDRADEICRVRITKSFDGFVTESYKASLTSYSLVTVIPHLVKYSTIIYGIQNNGQSTSSTNLAPILSSFSLWNMLGFNSKSRFLRNRFSNCNLPTNLRINYSPHYNECELTIIT